MKFKIKNNTDIQSSNIIIPGFIDLHCHGGNGFDVMEGSPQLKKCQNIIWSWNYLYNAYNLDKYI